MVILNVLDAKEDRRNASELYNPIVLEKIEVLSGHPPSWVNYVNKLVVGHDISANEVRAIILKYWYISNILNP